MSTLISRRPTPPPQRPRTGRAPLPWLLIGLELVTGVGAVGGAVYLIAGGAGMDPALLSSTPFTGWAWPGVALAIVVAIPMLVAAGAEWLRTRWASRASLASGVSLLVWITIQVALIGFQTSLQPALFLVGLAVTALATPRAISER